MHDRTDRSVTIGVIFDGSLYDNYCTHMHNITCQSSEVAEDPPMMVAKYGT